MSNSTFPEFRTKIPVTLVAVNENFLFAATSLINHHPELVLVGKASGCAEAISYISCTNSDLVLLDLDMPGRSGLETIQCLRQSLPHLTILVVSQMERQSCLKAVLKAGANGFIHKTRLNEDLIPAILRAIPEAEV